MPRGFGYRKPGLLTVNHCLMTPFTTVAGTTTQTAIFTASDAPGNRTTAIKSGSVLKKVLVRLWANDTTPVNGKHECFMLFQPGATTYTDPVANWFAGAEPLGEEEIQVRQNKLSRAVDSKVTVTGASDAPWFVCVWRGNRVMHDGDDVVICNRDAGATSWIGECTAWYIN